MTDTTTDTKKCGDCPCWQKMLKISKIKLCIAEGILAPLALLATRAYIGNVFWKSGKSKFDDGHERTTELFEYEYIPNWETNATKNILGMDITFPVPSPEFGATMATYTELLMPIFLVIGLAGRSAAFILFGMALSIELFVYPGHTEHPYWLLLLGLLVAIGPGKISIDHFIRKKFIGDMPKCCTICETMDCGKTECATASCDAPSCDTEIKDDKEAEEKTKEENKGKGA